jgi:hypothetical protein
MPFTQGATGRDHNGGTFVTWLAGAGVKSGASLMAERRVQLSGGRRKDLGYDLHATILHLLGIDHERLTYRHNGIDRRLTRTCMGTSVPSPMQERKVVCISGHQRVYIGLFP